MKLTEAIRLAKERAVIDKEAQAIVLLAQLSHGYSFYIPIEATHADGLEGAVVGELDIKGQMNAALEKFVGHQINKLIKQMEDLGEI